MRELEGQDYLGPILEPGSEIGDDAPYEVPAEPRVTERLPDRSLLASAVGDAK